MYVLVVGYVCRLPLNIRPFRAHLTTPTTVNQRHHHRAISNERQTRQRRERQRERKIAAWISIKMNDITLYYKPQSHWRSNLLPSSSAEKQVREEKWFVARKKNREAMPISYTTTFLNFQQFSHATLTPREPFIHIWVYNTQKNDVENWEENIRHLHVFLLLFLLGKLVTLDLPEFWHPTMTGLSTERRFTSIKGFQLLLYNTHDKNNRICIGRRANRKSEFGNEHLTNLITRIWSYFINITRKM